MYSLWEIPFIGVYNAEDSVFVSAAISTEATNADYSKEPNRTASNTPERYELFYATLVFHMALVCLMIFSNSLVIAAITRHKSLKSLANIFIGNLAVADLYTAILTIPINWIVHSGLIKPHESRIIYSAGIVPVIASLLFMVVISIERGMAIIKPFFYERNFTKRRAYIICVTIWVFCILLANSSRLFKNYLARNHNADKFVRSYTPPFIIVMVSVFGVSFVIITSLYGIISVIARHQAIRIWQQTHSDKERQKSEAKIRRMMITVLGVFYLCWTPQMVMMSVIFIYRYHPQWIRILEGFTECLCRANSFMNPIVYAYHDKKFRAAFKDLLRVPIRENDKELLYGTSFPVHGGNQVTERVSTISTRQRDIENQHTSYDDGWRQTNS